MSQQRYSSTFTEIRQAENGVDYEIHIFYKEGTDFDLSLEFFTDAAETVEQNWSGYTHSLVLKAFPDGSTAEATLTGGSGITAAATKTLTLNFTETITDALSQISYGDLKSQASDGTVHPSNSTRIVMHKELEV